MFFLISSFFFTVSTDQKISSPAAVFHSILIKPFFSNLWTKFFWFRNWKCNKYSINNFSNFSPLAFFLVCRFVINIFNYTRFYFPIATLTFFVFFAVKTARKKAQNLAELINYNAHSWTQANNFSQETQILNHLWILRFESFLSANNYHFTHFLGGVQGDFSLLPFA